MLKKIIHLNHLFYLILIIFTSGCNQTPETKITPTPVTPSPTITPNKPLIFTKDNPEANAKAKIEQYLDNLTAQGFDKNRQGIWMQNDDQFLAEYQSKIPLSAASLTKVATSLVTLKTFTPDHQFITLIGMTGKINQGVLEGDLVIQGGEDPLFVWEEAMILGNILNQKGIKKVTGNLIITGKFFMNFETNREKSGNLLIQGLNSKIWPQEAEKQFETLPPNTLRPQVQINGNIQVVSNPPKDVKLLVRHYSFPVAELIKKMNQYSNNLMADMLADAVGGPDIVAKKAADLIELPTDEIQLVNGSGLAEENRISPRAVVALFRAIERELKPYKMTVADVFTITGQDEGILAERQLPKLAIVKSGTLDTVSALAGALPTEKQGVIWFTIMNGGNDVDRLRKEQEILLKDLLKTSGQVTNLPEELMPNPERKGKISRNEIVEN